AEPKNVTITSRVITDRTNLIRLLLPAATMITSSSLESHYSAGPRRKTYNAATTAHTLLNVQLITQLLGRLVRQNAS
ncbi:MAG: hypothetical protein ABIF82_14040, partial [Planctomycetota bacterium]